MAKNDLWLAVTTDEYELPLAVCRTATELAGKLDTTESNVRSQFSRQAKNPKGGYKILKIKT